MNIIAAIKEALTIKKAVSAIQAAPEKGIHSSEFLSLILIQLSSVAMGASSLIPPLWSFYINIGLWLAWMLARLVLKHYHLTLAAVTGINAPDTDAIIKLLEAKFPKLIAFDAELREAAEIAKNPGKVLDAPAA